MWHSRKEFEAWRNQFCDLILGDHGAPPAARRIGREIALHINFNYGYAWPPQERLAHRTGCSTRHVRRMIPFLESWFDIEVAGKNYQYTPKQKYLSAVAAGETAKGGLLAQNVRNVTGHPVHEHRTPCPVKRQNSGHGVRLSSRFKPEDNLLEAEDHTSGGFDAASSDGNRERKVAKFSTEAISEHAKRNGAPCFAYENSEPFRAWLDYRNRNSVPGGAPPIRQRLVDGRLRTGIDVPSLYPPGYRKASGA